MPHLKARLRLYPMHIPSTKRDSSQLGTGFHFQPLPRSHDTI